MIASVTLILPHLLTQIMASLQLRNGIHVSLWLFLSVLGPIPTVDAQVCSGVASNVGFGDCLVNWPCFTTNGA